MNKPLIVVTWSDKLGAYRCEGNAFGVFASETGKSQEAAIQAWRKATGFRGEVKR